MDVNHLHDLSIQNTKRAADISTYFFKKIHQNPWCQTVAYVVFIFQMLYIAHEKFSPETKI